MRTPYIEWHWLGLRHAFSRSHWYLIVGTRRQGFVAWLGCLGVRVQWAP